MKRLTLILSILFLFAGLAQAQDVYFAGTNDSIGKIWKNNTLIYSINDTALVNLSTMQVTPDGRVYTAGYCRNSTYDYVQGCVWLNDSIIFNGGTNTAITKLALNGEQWTAAGVGENEWESVTGLVWQNGELLYAYSDSLFSNQIVALAIDTVTGDIYAGGSSSELEPQATVWKNDTILWREDQLSTIYDIALDDSDIYAAGSLFFGEQIRATLWQNDSIIFSIPSDNSEFDAIALHDGSIYLAGYNGDTLFIWRDNEILFNHPCTEYSVINALIVNGYGVYYAGQIDGVATVWKDGEILYQPEGCDNITSLAVLPTSPLPVFTINVESGNPDWGTVSGGGSYPYGDTIQIEAHPITGHDFLSWDDGDTNNPRDIVVTQDSTFIAFFGTLQFTITVESGNPDWGNVSGGGTFYYGDTIEIAASPNLGHVFLSWDDGNLDNPRSIVVTENRTYIGIFAVQQCFITTKVIPENSGTVLGGGLLYYGDTVSLIAQNNLGYVFSQWDDGDTETTKEIIVEGDATYTAVFHPLQFEITTECDPVEGGTVSGAGIYDFGTIATLKASANENYDFLCWSDGIVSNPRNVTVTQNANYKALFLYNSVLQYYTITVLSNNPLLGRVVGGGTYLSETTTEITAIPNTGAVFTGWQDDNMDNPRQIMVTGDSTFVASFAQEPAQTYTITIQFDEEQGYILGAGTYAANATATLAAIPNDGYRFVKWGDGNNQNPRTIVVTQNLTLAAFFNTTGVEENGGAIVTLYPNPTNDALHITGLEDENEISIYNALGICVKQVSIRGEEISVEDLPSGFYFILLQGKQPIKFVKQ